MTRLASTCGGLLAGITLLACASTHAFDNDRNGFLLGVGGGFHTSDIDADIEGGPSLSGDEQGIALRLAIGAGIGDRFAVYGILDNQFDSDAGYGLFGPGATYYFRDSGPSAYLFGATGLGVLVIDEEVRTGPDAGDDYEASDGYGLLFGGGYAFTQGFHLDGSLLFLDITDDDNQPFDVDYEIASLRIMASYVWF